MDAENMRTNDPWAPLATTGEDREKIWRENTSFAQDVWYRFRHKATALLGLVIVVFVALFCIAGPAFTGWDYDQQNLDFVSTPITYTAYQVGDTWIFPTQNLKLIEVNSRGELLRLLPSKGDDPVAKRTTFALSDDVDIVLDYGARPSQLTDAEGIPFSEAKTMHNRTYPLGSDSLGRDMLTRVMYGARISMLIALIAAFANLAIGVLYGGISGYVGGNVDAVMMRIVEIVSTIPLTLYVILIQVVLSNTGGITSIVIALSTVYWVDMARVVRGQMLTLKEQEYVYASRTIGTSTPRILLNHLIPNAMGPIIVTVTMLIPSAIFIEAFMSFIGLGVAPPQASLGTMCNDAIGALRSAPYQLFVPAITICLIMFGFNFVGDGLRDALDPKLRK